MPLVFSCIVPHPPIIIPEIGKGEIKKTNKTIIALKDLEKDFRESRPDTVLVVSPHSPLYPDAFTVSKSAKYSGNFFNFGEFDINMEFSGDVDLAGKIKKEAERVEIPIQLIDNSEMDHGAMVPLYYLSQNYDKFKIVLANFSFKSLKDNYEYGRAIRRVLDLEKDRKLAVIASGDLSHRITENAPAGYHPDGKRFDKELIGLLKNNQVNKILDLDPVYIENAGECGLRSIVILLGILSKSKYNINIFSYEAPFGVGYVVARFG